MESIGAAFGIAVVVLTIVVVVVGVLALFVASIRPEIANFDIRSRKRKEQEREHAGERGRTAAEHS